MLCVLIFTRFLMSGSVIQPIKIIENASNEIAAGSTAKRLTIKSSDEFGGLAKSINRMAEAIDDKIGKLKGSIAKEQAVVREQVILSELMAFIASGVELELLLTTFLGRTRDLLKAEHSAIFLLEKRAEKHDHVLKYFFNTFEQRTSLDCAEAMLNSVFRTVLNTFISLRTNSLMGEVPATHFTVKNLLAIPLSSADKKIAGLIVLVNKEGGFTPDDEEVLLNFSFQAFQAITMQQEVVHYATTDGLTGLNNHRVFIEQLNQEIERAARYSRDISLLMIDIDHFKSFNDIYGHQAGDRVLKNVAESIQKSIRATDFAARYGGEEFAVILPETIGEQALVVAERLRVNISAHELSLQKGERAFVTASIGFATYPLDADDGGTLIRKADQGFYLAKESGRNRICRHSDTHGKPDGALPDEVRHILKDTSLTSIKELAKAIDAKSNYMRGHSFEVAALSVMTAREMGLQDKEIEGLRIASLLHDIGNLSIPDAILNKPGRLTDEEKKIIQGHPGLTEILLRYYPMSESMLPAILYHHERFDGNGYPRGLKEEEIPVSAKILGVVEAYHAMVSPRPYKKRKTRLEAIAELEQEAGKQFDPLIIKTFVELLLRVQDPVEKRKKPDA